MENNFLSTTHGQHNSIEIRTESIDDSLNDGFYIKNDPYNHLKELNDARHIEQNLQKLLSDFHDGKLKAFRGPVSYEAMLKIREQQENLARLHFELNLQRSSHQQSGSFSSEEFFSDSGMSHFEATHRKSFSKSSVLKLIQNLQNLSKSIDRLQAKNVDRRF